MVFSSSTFLLVFLPAFLAVYFIVPNRAAKNVILLLASLVFYAWGEPVYVVLMVVSILANWLFALRVASSRAGGRRLWLVASLAVNLAILGFFKYEGFFAENVNALLGFAVVPDLELALPIGISFYTLQAISYVVDVYRDEVAPQRNLLYLGMYIAMFPQLVAGPIVRYQTIQEQITNRRENLRDFSAGARLFIVGLAKKVLLANVVAILADKMLDAGGSGIGAVGAWAGLVAYTFQIFFDFSGYSDMAIGLGRMCGFKYLRNFNYPYISKNISEFWRRWHISLGSFFRDYVYIPLGGNRCARPRWIFNTCVVWALTGFWHGAAWNFILWGLYQLVFILAEKFIYGKALERTPAAAQHAYAIIVFTLGWLVFWVEDMSAMGEYLLALFGAFGATGTSAFWELTAWEYLPIFLVCAIASTPIVPWLRANLACWVRGEQLKGFCATDLPSPKWHSTDALCDFEGYLKPSGATEEPLGALSQGKGKLVVHNAVLLAVDVALLALLYLSVCSVVAGSFNPFIYFRF